VIVKPNTYAAHPNCWALRYAQAPGRPKLGASQAERPCCLGSPTIAWSAEETEAFHHSPKTERAAAPGRPAGSPRPANRRAEFDFIRAFVVAGLVIFHSAIVFATGASFFVKDPSPNLAFTFVTGWGSLWGMPLLFVVSGMSVRYALQHRSAAAFVRERAARLLVPFLVGLALLVPPMFYLEQLGQPGFHEPYWRFWQHFFNLNELVPGLFTRGSWGPGVGFDPAHLWFLYCLLVFSIALLPLFLYLRRPGGARVVEQMAEFTERHGLVVLFTATIPLALVEATFGPDANTGGWERVAYLFPLLYGYLIASDRRFESALQRARRPALACALVATAALYASAAILAASGTDVLTGVSPGWDALQALAGWAWIVSIMGFAVAVSHRRDHQLVLIQSKGTAPLEPWWRRGAQYANEAVLPFYVLHEPVIVAAAWVIVRWNAPVVVKYVLLVIVAFAGTLTLYEVLVRRFPITRLLFGMKPRAQRAA
jgi:glucan biosynthesis protein C